MTIPPEHRIGRVVFEIAAAEPAAAGRFSALLRERFDTAVGPALEEALDRIDRPGEVVRLGRVEVDLGTFDQAALAGQGLRRRIAAALAAALGGAPGDAPSRDAAEAPDAISELATFLETGALPWVEPSRALAALAATLGALGAPAMARLAARLRTVLIRRLAAERLVRQLPAALVRRILRALLPPPLAAPLAAAFGPDRPAPAGHSGFVPEALVPGLAELILRLARNDPMIPGLGPELGEIIAAYAALDARAAGSAPPLPPAAPPPPEAGRAAEAADRTTPRPEATPRPVHAAGAVILHPFLSHFFDQLGLLEKPGRFRNRDARARAVLLTHHLATGAEDAPEPETPLFKLLCGMELAEPVPRRIDLTDAERSEAEALLRSVVTHWKRLGATSPAGLREGFLTRPGRLERQGETWRLRVERRGIDVLLDSLPWPLSRVQTPFMAAPLAVDWR